MPVLGKLVFQNSLISPKVYFSLNYCETVLSRITQLFPSSTCCCVTAKLIGRGLRHIILFEEDSFSYLKIFNVAKT